MNDCLAVVSRLPFFKEQKFRFLLDDVDVFQEWQLSIINSMIKVANDPYSFKVSCVGDYKTMSTFSDERGLSSTDLYVSRINDEDDAGRDIQSSRRIELFDAILNHRLHEVNTSIGKSSCPHIYCLPQP